MLPIKTTVPRNWRFPGTSEGANRAIRQIQPSSGPWKDAEEETHPRAWGCHGLSDTDLTANISSLRGQASFLTEGGILTLSHLVPINQLPARCNYAEGRKRGENPGLIGKLQLQELQVVCCLPKRIYLQESHQGLSCL